MPYGAISVTVERDNVYLQGLVTEAEAKRITEVTAGVGGVKEVYTLFQIMTPEQAQARENASRASSGLPESNPTPTGNAPTSGPNTMDGNAPAPGQPRVEPVTVPSTPQAKPP